MALTRTDPLTGLLRPSHLAARGPAAISQKASSTTSRQAKGPGSLHTRCRVTTEEQPPAPAPALPSPRSPSPVVGSSSGPPRARTSTSPAPPPHPPTDDDSSMVGQGSALVPAAGQRRSLSVDDGRSTRPRLLDDVPFSLRPGFRRGNAAPALPTFDRRLLDSRPVSISRRADESDRLAPPIRPPESLGSMPSSFPFLSEGGYRRSRSALAIQSTTDAQMHQLKRGQEIGTPPPS